MISWNVVYTKNKEYELLNGSSTLIKCSPKSNPDISWLMSRMEELGVPPAYSHNLEEIYFTRLVDDGDYSNGRIRISVYSRSWVVADKILVHELAHHVDDIENLTDNDMLLKEKKKKVKYMPDGYARKNVGEYLACGFEVYYCGTEKQKKTMKKKNPVLYKTIEKIHDKYVTI